MEHASTSLSQASVMVTEQPAPVIDISSYPHIFDSIIAFAPKSSLLALRATCKAVRDRVDATFGHHLVFTCYAPANVQGKDGRSPALYGFEELSGDKLHDVLQHTRIADVVGPLGLPELRGYEISFSMSLDTLRLRHHPAGRPPSSIPFVAPTLITFTTFIEIGILDEPAVAEVGHVPDGVEHFILDLRYDPGRSWMPQAHVQPFGRPSSLKSVTIFFTQKTTHQEEEVWFRQASKPMGILNSIVLGMAMAIPKGVEYTLVDVQTLRPEWLGSNSDGTAIPRDIPDAIERAITSSVAAQCMKWERYDKATAQAAVDKIKFLTRDEYRALVGEERFALETME